MSSVMGLEQAGHCKRELVLRSTRREVRDVHHVDDGSLLLLNSLPIPYHAFLPIQLTTPHKSIFDYKLQQPKSHKVEKN